MRPSVRRGLFIAGGTLVAALVAARIALPYVVEDYVNRKLAENPAYRGSIEDVDISLLRGAYTIDGLTLEKIDGDAPVPFLDITEIDLSVEWRALLHGAVVAEIELREARLNFVNGPAPEDKQAGEGVDWKAEVKKLVPIRINRFAIVDGEVHFADFSTQPPIDVWMKDLELEARNLGNAEKSEGIADATVDATAGIMGPGRMKLHVNLDPLAELPTFDLNAAVEDVNVPDLNSLLQGYGKFDAEAGELDLFCELASKEGRFTGYVKPVLTDLKVMRLQEELDDGDGPLRIAWETVVGAAKGLLENDREEQVATKVPIDGAYDAPEVGTWSAVWSAVQNAFIEALFRGIDNDVTLATVGGQPQVVDEREARKQAREERRAERRSGD